MKSLLLIILTPLLLWQQVFSQKMIKDEAMRYQQERMVFKQWDKNKFKPTAGLLGVNPYYWATWGLMPSYKKKDLRPLSASGPQTQRLVLAGAMNNTSNEYKKQSDGIRNTALSEIAGQSGALSDFDPLWLLYYSRELRPVLEWSPEAVLLPLPTAIRTKVVCEGLFDWYTAELASLKERLLAARSVNLDRGTRIIAWHRLLLQYRQLEAAWSTRTANGVHNADMLERQSRVKSMQVKADGWSPYADVEIAKQVLKNRKY
ncbi:hypothetical protein EOD41_14830 [Mucilaginibacter limnophilus]|uniref:Uncharacterized protein n=1 Tax=Mucilaginibacter limnophilus TaxID=1932778 RepID=A0A437MQ01_9SPHI|nr:hypothetical protein [Mucilaginibacter limnophilus]RVT99717.1 hypothetical protein EOD41_14830 [Mucilaginibacter limnophilus]